jgi:hypothetical protein
VCPDHPDEGLHAVDAPECLDALRLLPKLVLLLEDRLHVLQQTHQGLVEVVEGLAGRLLGVLMIASSRYIAGGASLPVFPGASDEAEFLLCWLPDAIVVDNP